MNYFRNAPVPEGIPPEAFNANVKELHRVVRYARKHGFHINCPFCSVELWAPHPRENYKLAPPENARTKGHLVPSTTVDPPRLWVYQCRRCNSSQKSMTLYQWHHALLKGHDRRAVAVAALIKDLMELGVRPHRMGGEGHEERVIGLQASGERFLSYAQLGN